MSDVMKRTFIVLFAMAVLAESGVANAETKQVQFEGPIRLKQALNAIEKQGLLADVYWPAVRLIKTDEAAELEQKKQKVLLQLDELEAYWRGRRETDKADAALMLQGQIKGWQLGQQYWGGISIEQARQNLADNPLLPEGSYSLVLSERPEHIYAYGLVSKPGKYEFHTGKTVANWLNSIEEQSELLDGYNKNVAVVVSVDNEQQANWAYYKQSDTELMPGNILWLGFEPNQLPPKYKSLNDDIRGLLKHFVVDTSVRSATNAPVYQANAEPTSEWHWSRRDLSPSYNDYGSVGLLQNPTARMMEEGAFAITYSDMEEYRRYTVNLQLLPWLETTAFYTEFPNKLYSDVPDFSGDNILADKGFDIKARLWEESYWLPEVSVGFRDFAGTGLFDAEYVVANKRFGPVDVSLGLGFGRLGTHDDFTNPFCELSDEYCQRESSFGGNGGKVEFDRWFTGPMAVFGGARVPNPLGAFEC